MSKSVKASVDLRFERRQNGSFHVHVGEVTGDVRVEVEG